MAGPWSSARIGVLIAECLGSQFATAPLSRSCHTLIPVLGLVLMLSTADNRLCRHNRFPQSMLRVAHVKAVWAWKYLQQPSWRVCVHWMVSSQNTGLVLSKQAKIPTEGLAIVPPVSRCRSESSEGKLQSFGGSMCFLSHPTRLVCVLVSFPLAVF